MTTTTKTGNQISFTRIAIDNVEIFYREAGQNNKETILFLHGFPSSSFMYRHIMERLAGAYHVIAPDYPGFGHSSILPVTEFSYTFDNIALVMEKFIDALALKKFHLYMQDYGGPVGFRIAAKRPELIQSLLIQNANAYTEGLGPAVQQIGALQQAGDERGLRAAVDHMISFEGIKEEYIHGAENPELISPDAYTMDAYFMKREGVNPIQQTLFSNYGTNFPKYKEWQDYLRKYQPAALIMWGRHDNIFTVPGAEGYKKDLPQAELHILNGGHFALEEHHAAIAGLITAFLLKAK